MAAWPARRLVLLLAVAALLHADGKEEAAAADDPCRPNPCRNFGECFLSPDGERACICAKGFAGDLCEENVNDCMPDSCKNGGRCIDEVRGFHCECPFGFYGHRCEGAEFWTLQQWRAGKQHCHHMPWRCFRLQLGRCIDTGHSDERRLGNHSMNHSWYGRLTEEDSGNFTLDLCFGRPVDDDDDESGGGARQLAREGASSELESAADGERSRDSDDGRWEVPSEWCDCGNRITNIPRFGLDGIGPFLHRDEEGHKDSKECHHLLRTTPSRLQNSTGAAWSQGYERDEEITNIDCRPSGSVRAATPLSTFGLTLWLSWLRCSV